MRDAPLQRAVEIFAILHLLAIGLSHVLAPRAWVDVFALLHRQGKPGAFAVAFMSLWFGSIVAAFHDVWSGIPAILTLIGWAQVVKGLVYFAFPGFGLRRIAMVTPQRTSWFAWGGFVLLVPAALLAWHLASS